MTNNLFMSSENYFKSNSLKAESIKLSPLLFTQDLQNQFMFSNDLTPNKINDKKSVGDLCQLHQLNLSHKELFDFSPLTKDISPVKDSSSFSFTTTYSSIFTEKNKINKFNGKDILLSQICINGHQLKYFPIYAIPKEELAINIIDPLYQAKNFCVIPKEKCVCDYYITEIALSNIEIENLKEILEVDNISAKDINTHREIILYIYERIKYTIHSIQLNFILQKKKTINENLLNSCAKYIQNANKIMDIVLFKPPKELNRIRLLKKKRDNDYKERQKKRNIVLFKNEKKLREFKCALCGKLFNSGCGLGGHMSRVHPHKSEQYKKKQKTREKRNEFREAIIEAKMKFCKKHGMVYKEMMDSKEKKEKLKKIIMQYRKEYAEILKKVKFLKGLLDY